MEYVSSNNTPAAEEWRVQGRSYISTFVAKPTMKCATCQCEGWPFALQEYLPKRKVLGVMSVWVYFSCYTRLESRWELVVSVEITTFLPTNADGSIAICHILNQWIATEFIKALKFWVNLHHFLILNKNLAISEPTVI